MTNEALKVGDTILFDYNGVRHEGVLLKSSGDSLQLNYTRGGSSARCWFWKNTMSNISVKIVAPAPRHLDLSCASCLKPFTATRKVLTCSSCYSIKRINDAQDRWKNEFSGGLKYEDDNSASRVAEALRSLKIAIDETIEKLEGIVDVSKKEITTDDKEVK